MIKPIFGILVLISSLNTAIACDFKDISFDANYDQGGLARCEQLSETEFILHIEPEDTPINPSPWYNFTISSKVATTVSIAISAGDARPRYLPKRSLDGSTFEAIPFTLKDGDMHIAVEVNQQPVMISAQQVIDNEDYVQWQQTLTEKTSLLQREIGKSTEGRSIYALVHSKPENKEWLLLIGRQHPPEISGAQAYLAFAQAMFIEHANESFLNRFNVLLVPNMNPDGVAHGHWRHNVKGTDLNRDWGKFTQAETQAVYGFINEIIQAEQRIVFALDFHSTQQDIFYTMPSDYGLAPALFSEEYLADLKPHLVSSFTLRERPGSSPGRGVLKQYLADEFKIHSITYEMGDNTPLEMVNHVATQAAKVLQNKMLATPPEAFIFKPE
ncbi:DUF2817 domain-containing protein [Glaciecola sp. XM2]|jgi:hypothetical protein|uniref:M14 family metallopeptidase n=1 Tax=Glaciecola sp. XM2 TaxID=1914931 RepID=UPI001BDE7538|nr:M14 family zinc carboxypeptidase [Glaciecola sp. XM2]MBT1451656.1 DUF2817 domain-containing protein [Glaciecola sp. XM2]